MKKNDRNNRKLKSLYLAGDKELKEVWLGYIEHRERVFYVLETLDQRKQRLQVRYV